MLFAIKIYDTPNSGPLRDASRQAHLAYLRQYEAQTRFAGPFLAQDGATELGSLRLMDLPDRAAAEQNVAAEPYIQAGAQEGATIHRWSALVPHTFRDCPRKEGNLQFLIYALDKTDAGALRAAHRTAHLAFQESRPDLFITRGTIITDDGTTEIGSLMLLDVPDLGTAQAFWEKDPLRRAGLFGRVEFYRWRFGRAFKAATD